MGNDLSLDDVRRLRFLVETQGLINSVSLDIAQVMRVVTERAQSISGADCAVVELVEGDEMVYRAASGTAAANIGLRLKTASSLSGLCVTSGVPLVCQDTEADSRVDLEACRRTGMRSMVVVPLLVNSGPVGVLKVSSVQPRRFGDAEVATLQEMAGFVATALANATAYGDAAHQALHDRLTGLPNRALLIDRVDQALAKARRYPTGLALLFIDLDNFKMVNDVHGHLAGDQLLKGVAAELARQLRETDTLARLGGDEFVLLCEGLSREGMVAVRERVLGAVLRAVGASPAFAGVTASVGAYWSEGQEPGAEEVLSRADAEMYRVKRDQKSRPGLVRP